MRVLWSLFFPSDTAATKAEREKIKKKGKLLRTNIQLVATLSTRKVCRWHPLIIVVLFLCSALLCVSMAGKRKPIIFISLDSLCLSASLCVHVIIYKKFNLHMVDSAKEDFTLTVWPPQGLSLFYRSNKKRSKSIRFFPFRLDCGSNSLSLWIWSFLNFLYFIEKGGKCWWHKGWRPAHFR